MRFFTKSKINISRDALKIISHIEDQSNARDIYKRCGVNYHYVADIMLVLEKAKLLSRDNSHPRIITVKKGLKPIIESAMILTRHHRKGSPIFTLTVIRTVLFLRKYSAYRTEWRQHKARKYLETHKYLEYKSDKFYLTLKGLRLYNLYRQIEPVFNIW